MEFGISEPLRTNPIANEKKTEPYNIQCVKMLSGETANARHNAMTASKLSAEIQEFLNRPATSDFLRSARQFVERLELDNPDMPDFLSKSHSALVELYATGHRLEIIPLKYSSANNEFDPDSSSINKNVGLITQVGEKAFYWEVFDPTYAEQDGQPGLGWKITDKEPSQGWLVDDFSDIYDDLKIELHKIDTIGTDEAVEDAMWQMKWGFFHHWGYHCINAIRYLHYWNYEGKNAL